MLKSHLERTEEKRLAKRLALLLVIFTIFLFFGLFQAIPLLAKFSLILSNLGSRSPDKTDTSLATPLLPPTLNTTFTATNSATISVSGFANAGQTVEILVNDESQAKTLSNNQGQFTVNNISLTVGENRITAYVKKGDQVSRDSEPLVIVYQKNPPKLEIAHPIDGENYSDSNSSYSVLGTTDPGNRVTVNDRLAIVDGNGQFSSQINLRKGENKLKITAIDQAGNQTTLEKTVNYNP